MRKILATLTVKQKFRVLILAIVIGFGIFGWQTLETLSLVKVNGALYRDIISGKDLTADILPPPEYILESYLAVQELNNETDVNKIEKYIGQLAQLKLNYLDRHQYWMNQLHGKTMEIVFLKDSYEPAMRFYEVVENQFIPAVRKGDAQMKKRLLEGEIKAAYLEHRKQIDKVVGLASTWSSTIEKHAQSTTESSIIALVLLISIVLGCIVILSLYIGGIISSEEKYRKFFEDDLSGVYLSTPQGEILDCNQSFAAIFGFNSIEEALNSNTETLYMNPDDLRFFLNRLQHEKKLFNYEVVLKKQDGRPIMTVGNVIGIFDRQGKLTGFQGYIIDITERKKAEERIITLNQELEQRVLDRTIQLEASNKELEAFSYSVSHDLRTPLRGIDGFSLALIEDYHDKIDEQGKKYLQRIRLAAQNMAQLIDDMLGLARVNRSEIDIQQVNLSEIAREIAHNLHGTQPERMVKFIIQEGIEARCDSHLLRIVLENLIGNAWKFTSKHPTARIEFGMQLQKDTAVYFVRDDGAGFDMKYAQKLFGAFQRLHTAIEFQGTGIGLATVQRIIHRHGGRVWAEGEVEKGATFYFTLHS